MPSKMENTPMIRTAFLDFWAKTLILENHSPIFCTNMYIYGGEIFTNLRY